MVNKREYRFWSCLDLGSDLVSFVCWVTLEKWEFNPPSLSFLTEGFLEGLNIKTKMCVKYLMQGLVSGMC